MPTTNQLIRFKGRKKVKRVPKRKHITGRPQRTGTVQRAGTINPRKPNSGQRKICRVRFDDGSEVTCLIPGEGHNIQEHARVLVEGGGTHLPGVKYRVIRGHLDTRGVDDRKSSRSRYGAKRDGN